MPGTSSELGRHLARTDSIGCDPTLKAISGTQDHKLIFDSSPRKGRLPGYSTSVIVWVCSYPRSGNTFLRTVLKRLYGVRTSVIYDVDGVAQRLGREMVGYTDRAGTIEAMRAYSLAGRPRSSRAL